MFFGISVLSPVNAALWNKRYVVKSDQGNDFLCDPYVVQENDWIYKIFRQKGEISEQNFLRFLEIFKRLNSDISDINRIYPGDIILIPLKTITQDTLPIPPAKTVTIPFASISNRPADTVVIRKGDSVSRLLSRRFGNPKSAKYREGLRRFKELNPEITNLNLLIVGQQVRLPTILQAPPDRDAIAIAPSARPAPETTETSPPVAPKNQVSAVTVAANPPMADTPAVTATSLAQVAEMLDAELFDRGNYHFPGENNGGHYLDLNLFPVMRLKDQTRILFIRPFSQLSSSDLDVVKSYWKNLRIVRIPAPPVSAYQFIDKIFLALNLNQRSPGKTTFADGDTRVYIKAKWSLRTAQTGGKPDESLCVTPVEKGTKPFPETIFNYLARHHITYWEIQPDGKLTGTSSQSNSSVDMENPPLIMAIDPKYFVREVASALGWTFQDQVEISFPYAGVQVDAVSSMVSAGPARSCLVDFGNFAGDSISAIKATGLKVVSLSNSFDPFGLLHRLLDTFSIAYTDKPTVAVRNQNDGRGVFFTYPGVMVDLADGKALFTTAIVPLEQQQFLYTRGIQAIRITR